MGLGDFLEDAFHVGTKFVDVAWHAAPPVAVAGFAIDVATSPFNDDPDYNGFWNTLASRGAARIGDILEPIDIIAGEWDEKAIDAVVPQLERAWSYGFARPLTSLMLASDSDVNRHKGTIFNPASWDYAFRDAWNASRDVSPGQAFAASWLGGAGVVADSLGVDPETISPVAKPDFDITDPADRAAYRSGGSLAQLLSGAIDARLRWSYDPAVLAFGAAGAVRQATLVRPLEGSSPGRMPTSEFRNRYSGVKPVVIGARPVNVDEALNSKRVTGLLDELAAMDPARRADFLARQKAFRHNVGIQTLLTQADNADEMRLVFKYAMDKSMRNREQLAARRKDLADQVEMLQDVRIPTLERVLAGSYSPAYANRVTPVQLEQANRQLANADRQYHYARNLEMAEASLVNVPRVTVGGRLMDRVDWAVYQPSRLNMPMRVLKSAGTMRAGIIDYNRAGNATEQVRRMLDRVGHAQDLTRIQPRMWSATGRPAQLRPGSGLTQEAKGALIAAVAKAETRGPEALEGAIRAAELAVMRHHATRLGVSTDVIDEIARTSWHRMDEARASMSGGAAGGRFTGAKKVDAEGQPTKRYLDEVDDDGVGVRHRPLLDSQQANLRPILDTDALARVIGRNKAALVGDEAAFLTRLRGDAVAQRSTIGVVEEALDAFNRFWKPAQLMRLGWPLRVVTDEQMRIMATLGAMSHLPLFVGSLKESVSQGSLGYRVRDAATAHKRVKPGRELKGMAASRAEEMARLGLVDRVAALDTRLAKLEERIARQAARVQTYADEFAAYRSAAVRDRDVAAVYGGGTLGVAHQMRSAGLEQARARLQALYHQRDAVTRTRDQVLGRSQAITPWTDEMYARWDELNDAVMTPTQRREAAGGRKGKFAGDVTYRDRNGREYTVPDAFAGEVGKVFMDLSSSKGAMRSLALTQDRYLNMMRAKAGQPILIHPVPPENMVGHKLKAYKANYDASWVRAVNDQIGKDPIGKLILLGKTDEQIVGWMRRSDAGRELRRRNTTRGRDPYKWVAEVRLHVDHYLPTDELRVLAREGRATADDLKNAVPQVHHRPEIHGESLTNALDGSPLWSTWDAMVDTAYRKLGAAPTDVLSRHPYFANIYRQEMGRQVGAYHLADDAMIPAEVIERMQHNARQTALNKTRETLYELSNQANLAHTLKFIAPFYAAWQEALTTWGRLWMEDPSRLMRISQIWEAPSKAQLVYTDSNGREYFVLPLPKGIREQIPGGLGESGIPKYWMKDLIAQGNYWMLPGVGGPVTLPTAALVRERPDLHELLAPILPYGAGENLWDEILPAGWKRGVSLYRKEDDYAYSQAKLRIIMDLETDRRLGKNDYTPEQLYAEARRRTDDFFRVRMVANLSLPFAPNYRSPYQFYIDQAKVLREEYMKLPGAKDPNGKTWEERYLDLYGEDYFIFTGSSTKTNVGGIAPTVEGFQATRKYADLIAKNPDLGGLIVGDEDEGEFSSEVFQWQRGERIGPGTNQTMRELVSPEDAVKGVQIRRGWSEYMKINNALNTALFARGLRTFEASKARDLKAARQMLIAHLEQQYPAWADERRTFTIGKANQTIRFLEENIDDERFAGRAGFTTLAEYLALRRAFAAALGARQVHNLQAKANDDLRAAWQLLVGQMKEKDLAFSDLYDRWLDNDTMEDGGQ